MHLVYLDESGNSGGNLADPAQPVFVLAALIVAETRWQALEQELAAAVDRHWPPPRPEGFEIHAAELVNPKTALTRAATPAQRLAFITDWLKTAERHGLKLVFRAIVKQRYQRWLLQAFGAGVIINPHVAAFAMVAQVVNSHLSGLPGGQLGIFISDENHQVARDVDKAIRVLRGEAGAIRLTQIVEKGFFVESHSSLVLQLCDLCAYIVRRHVEAGLGRPAKAVDAALWNLVRPLVTSGDEKSGDVIAWLEARQKRSGQGTKPRERKRSEPHWSLTSS